MYYVKDKGKVWCQEVQISVSATVIVLCAIYIIRTTQLDTPGFYEMQVLPGNHTCPTHVT